MTDTLESLSDETNLGAGKEPDGSEPSGPMASQPEGRTCQAPGCDNLLPSSGSGWHWRRFCDNHQPGRHGTSKTTSKAPRKDKAPPSSKAATARSATRADDLAQVEKNAKFIAEMIGGGLGFVAETQHSAALKADAVDIQAGSAAWAASVRNLAEYEDWLRKMLSGGKASDRAMAWFMFAISTGSIAVPIMVRHGVLPADLAAQAQAVADAGAATL